MLGYLRQPVIAVFIIGLLFVLVQIFLTDRVRPYTSDDVAWQSTLLTWRPGSGDIAHFGSDPFIVKLPYYFLLNALFEPSRGLLLVTTLLFAALNFILFYYAALYFYRLFKVKLTLLNLTPVLWLASMGYWFSSQFLNPNLRNFELGLMCILFMYGIKVYRGEVKPFASRVSTAVSVVAAAAIGALIISDLYFFYFGVVPLGIMAASLTYFEKRNKTNGLQLLGLLGLSYVFAKFIKYLVTRAGIEMIVSAGDKFAPLNQIPRKMFGTTEALHYIFNATFWNRTIENLATLGFLLNAALVSVMLLMTWIFIAKKRLYKAPAAPAGGIWRAFLLMLFGFILAIYATTTTTNGADTYRYLVLLPYIFVLLAVPLLSEASKKIRQLLAFGFALATLLNFYTPVTIDKPKLSGPSPNQSNMDIISAVKKRRLIRGYAAYWDANINTYLSQGSVRFLPVSCTLGQRVVGFTWLVDGKLMRSATSERTFLLKDHTFAQNGCNEEKLMQQFGTPEEVFSVVGRTVYVYDYDILAKF